MTAVIGIINKSAAAIASDSAVTVAGPKGPKIFNRANKLFRISKFHPIGAVIYNQGEFMGTGWEAIMKLYRAQLKDKYFATVSEYKDDFIKFLHDKHFFCDTQQQRQMLLFLIVDFLRQIADGVFKKEQANAPPGPPNLNQLLVKIEQEIDRINAESIPGNMVCNEFADFEMKEFEDFGLTGIGDAIRIVFHRNGLPADPVKFIPKIKQLAFSILKSKRFYTTYSGLVFAGFGEEEIFPSLIPVNISVAINNRLRWFDDDKSKAVITHNAMSFIRPFAQKDVIDTMLKGTDPGLYNLYLKQFEQFITKNNLAIATMVDKKDPAIAKKIREIDSRQLTSALHDLISQQTRKFYVEPMMGAVSTLSKEDLAEMAESLIYLTYLKKRFTFSEENVGGPVDVAVITKGDGFIWIKRKHYFSPDLNHHFFKNY
jgi:hypothetical protein